VDVVLDLMIHDIDIILTVVPSPLESISTIGVPVVTRGTDVAAAQLTFANGCTANVTVSRVHHDNVRSLRIYQLGGSLTVNYATKEIKIIDLLPGVTPEGYPNEKVTHFCFTEQDALADELTDFVRNVRLRTQPQVAGPEGRRALDIALRIIGQIRDHIDRHKDILCNGS
jgi:predicted dehydrogenase